MLGKRKAASIKLRRKVEKMKTNGQRGPPTLGLKYDTKGPNIGLKYGQSKKCSKLKVQDT